MSMPRPPAILIMASLIGVEIAIGIEIKQKRRNSNPISIPAAPIAQN